jgi:Putative prokaryotic signal transducing protein
LLATPEDFQRHFEILSDDALLETNRDELVEMAREVYDEEIARRGLGPEEGEELTPESELQPTDAADEMVLIATFGFPEEANMARGLLESASIPSQIKNELAAVGGFEARLLVPASFEEQAVEILESQVSDEELAAQAEAAGMPHEGFVEDEEFAEEAEPPENDE